MKTKVRVGFNGNDVPGREQAVLGPAGCGPDVADVDDNEVLRQVFVYVTLYEDDPRLQLLIQRLRAYHVEWNEARWDTFTDEEFEAARLIVMTFANSRETIFGGPRAGTTYDMSEACKLCGAGARQTSAMVVDGEYLHLLESRRVASTCYNDILVDEGIARALVQSGATGLSFRGVFAAFEKKGHFQLPLQQLCATHTVPPMSPRSTGIELAEPCPCGRSSFDRPPETPPRLVYRASDVADIRDVNVTWEWFGEVHFDGDVSEALFPYPWFLVTPKVWRIFRDAGVTGFDWMPIRVEEE